jgi:uncharacterized repeat protein (TIGR03803 family)
MKLLIVIALLAASGWRAEASGTWTPLVNPAPDTIAQMLLLTDGTVITNSGSSTKWWRLTPDIHGSYVNGTWSLLSSMNYPRLYYASQVMNDGDVFIAGGEYGANGRGDPTAADTAEVWNSRTNTWSLVPNTNYQFADAISKLLPSGKVLVGCAWEQTTVLYDPVSNTSTPAETPLGSQNEADWVKLPDESILMVDGGSTEVDRYIPSVDIWVQDTATPVDLYSPDDEIGSLHLLPNGKVFAIGGAPVTAIYTPSGSTNPGTWVQGPNIPNNQGANDGPAASMVNGKILMAVDPADTYSPPCSFYEYDYVANTLTQVNGPTGITENTASDSVRMLALPDGSILSTDSDPQCYVYQPDGTPLAVGKPSIHALTTNSDGSYHLTGTGFNGISEGAKYGDDVQMDTNWPIVRVTNTASGNVYYAKTFGWTPGVVATGTTEVATDFSFPAGLPAGTYSLVVVANGNSSDPVAFPPVATPAFSPPAGTYTSAQTVTISTATSGASIRYTTDNSLPSETNGTLYSGPVSISTTTTLQALAYKTGYNDSAVTMGTYTFSYTISSSSGFDNLPMPSSQAGTFTTSFDASPSLSPSNAVIALSKGAQTAYTGLACIARFNTSGDIDAYNGTAYQAASVIPYTKNTTYHFRMVVNVPANTYSVYVTPPGGSELTVGLNYKFRTAVTSLDTWPIDVNATPGGSVTVSNLALGNGLQQVAAPTFSPGAGTYDTVQTVLINDSTSGASIRYTTDGVTTPTETVGTFYTGSISISNTTKLEAIAYKAGMTDSMVTTGQYTLMPLPAAPVFSPGPGTYASTSAPTVTITSLDASSIYYTTNGSNPTSSSTLYTAPIPISTSLTLKAIGTNAAGMSPVASGIYVLTTQVIAPTFSPPAGGYQSAQSVAITSATNGALIAYTTDGSTPTESGGTVTHGTSLANSGVVTISTFATLNAIAYQNGLIDSTVTSGDYAITPVIVRYSFTASSNGGINPNANLVQGSDGNYYGTTFAGGSANDGTVYKMTPAGVLTTLVSFTGANGASPLASLVQGSDGNFYGTTASGGTGNFGTVFKMTPAGVLTTLVSFTGANNGSYPYAGLIQGSDGNFYGTTQGGGSAGDGTVFKLTPAGVLTTLVSFTGANGSTPEGTLVQGSDGNFYGTTSTAGSASDGTVFKLTPAGVLTTLVSFDGTTNGFYPVAGLVQGSDGNFYGMTEGDGDGSTFSNGTAFKLTPAGVLTTLVTFTGSNGANPLGALVQGSDGNFYGTTNGGGSASDGTVFKLTPAGVLTTLDTFYGGNGSGPNGLVQGSDGNFYGTTNAGGTFNDGVVFEVRQVAAPAFSPGAGTYTSAQTVTITSTTSGAAIAYTTDGSTPTESGGTVTHGTVLSNGGSVSISATTTLKAIAYETGLTDSLVTTGLYTIGTPPPQVAAPSFSPAAGTYTSAQTVTITTATSGASIRYTTDGVTTPTETVGTLYSGPVSISVTATLKAMAYESGFSDSTVTSGLYTISLPQVAAPTFSPAAGTYTSAQTVTITTTTGGTSIRYTTDGVTTPTETVGTLYSGPVPISVTTTLKAIAYKTGMTDSAVTSGLYTINIPQVAAPSFSPAAGTYTSAQTVTISTATSGASIRYTTDGSTPSETAGALYSSPVSISATATLKALAYKTGMTDSAVTSGLYTINIPQVAAPSFSPAAGTYTSAQTVTISTATSGASIRYTTDGSTPSETAGTLYSSPVSISATVTLKALAYKTGMADSGVTSGLYTINTVTRSLSGTSSNGFHALALTSAQAGTFTATFDATPSVSPENAVVGLSKGVATAYTGLSCIARFNPTGQIDAYNGTAYAAAATINYSANVSYHFRMVVNVTAHTYSVYVTPAGGSELTVGLNYGFRVVQTSLDTWNLDLNATPAGCSLTANNLNP